MRLKIGLIILIIGIVVIGGWFILSSRLEDSIKVGKGLEQQKIVIKGQVKLEPYGEGVIWGIQADGKQFYMLAGEKVEQIIQLNGSIIKAEGYLIEKKWFAIMGGRRVELSHIAIDVASFEVIE